MSKTGLRYVDGTFSNLRGLRLVLLWLAAIGATHLSAAEQAKVDPSGFIYAEVTVISGGSYRGLMRWGREEAFWGDHFNSKKLQLPFLKHLPQLAGEVKNGKGKRRASLKRGFACRFGDIEQIIVNGNEDAIVHMKSGSMFQVSGYANDVGKKLLIWDEDRGETELKWTDIAKIEFIPSEAGQQSPIKRLYGVVSTDQGDLEGYIQWDLEECLHSDELNGKVGENDLDLKMGLVQSIERKDPGVVIIQKDGKTYEMYGTNDVNHENRGIMVENPAFGRVKIGWSRFRKVTFQDVSHTGPSFDAFDHQAKLQGTVTLANGDIHQGDIVFNMDQNEQWAFLNAGMPDMDYTIPLGLVVSLEPQSGAGCLVVLRDGTRLNFTRGSDIDDRNLGILVFAAGKDQPDYLAWHDVRRLEFAK